ncbi:MAG: helix-turn-helix domain-containing protein [Oscillospiraceae bacterium]|nr:helix-turn-helix domain-containing protein [Oscillospiraceae bacterium]
MKIKLSLKVELSLGEKLKDLRKEKRLTLKELSEALGGNPNPSSLGDYENNNKIPSFDFAIKLANYYKVSLEWLGGLSEIRNPKIEMRAACKFTGLSEKAIEAVNGIDPHQKMILSKLTERYFITSLACYFDSYLNSMINSENIVGEIDYKEVARYTLNKNIKNSIDDVSPPFIKEFHKHYNFKEIP